ncbi:Bax inhibitor-1/YccA family protein [bacterium]|nr:Bax inhibitor-1/YccA family protein [bacterium]
MKTTNPMLNDNILKDGNNFISLEKPMTVSGAMNKLLYFFFVSLTGAAISIYQYSLGNYDFLNFIAHLAFIPLLVIGAIIAWKKGTTPYLGTLFTFIQGAWTGAFSCSMEKQFNGVVSQAIILTLLVILVMAMLFKFRIIRATEKFKSTLFIGTTTIFLYYIISFILMFFFHVSIPYFDPTNAGYFHPLTILLNIIIVIFASLNLILDFDYIEQGEKNYYSKSCEWYGAFALMVTIIWLYIEILRLVSRFSRR